MSAETLTLRQQNRATLARQMLLAREPIAPLRAIERLVALQAQWPRPPFLGLLCRLKDFECQDLRALLDRRRVVRATFLRATLHLVSARDFVALRPAIQPALDNAMRSILKQRGASLDLDRLVAHARELLADGPLTFEDMRDRLLRSHPKEDERAMGYAIRMLLPLVQVPVVDEAAWGFPAQARFALAEEWLGLSISREPAPPDALVLRYLAAYGPASVADMQAWSGVAGLRETVDRLRPRLRVFRDEQGRELLDLPGAPRPDGNVPAPVRLVPEYDNLIVARADERLVARRHRPRVFLSALRVAATVLVDGFVGGIWRLERTKGAAVIKIEPFAPLSARTRKAVTDEANRVACFAEPDARTFDVRVGG
jgi:hypothetical protein